MGIPSYFMHIVRNYPRIIHAFSNSPMTVDHLYLDCNSIIYAAYYAMESESACTTMTPDIGKSIIADTCRQLDEYIRLIDPQKSVLVAFDGVAPVAKLEQQRARRYKAIYQQQRIVKSANNAWSTTAITPGTIFMRELSARVTTHFKNNPMVRVSGSDQVGEGEHKIFAHIRKVDHRNDTTVIYGLDADLIMLSINHLSHCPRLYLFRETPEFIQSIDRNLEPNANYVLDIPAFATAMQSSFQIPPQDYIFMCFFLGNDFMPHFPALNIRTGGHDKLMEAYRELNLGMSQETQFIRPGPNVRVQWDVVARFVSYLAGLEEGFLLKEHKLRDAMSRRLKQRIQSNVDNPAPSAEERRKRAFEQFEQTPQVERDIERAINPFRGGWRDRYYVHLFQMTPPTPDGIRDVCRQYVEGLEWTMKYYSQDCPNYRWKYSYHYPPLLSDLAAYLAEASSQVDVFDGTTAPPPVDALVQLCYVLPKSNMHLLPAALAWKLESLHPEWHRADNPFCWAYCRYFWEAHVHMPTISIPELETIVLGRAR